MVGGSRLADRYVLRDRLASGGMGFVFVAFDERLGREVAVKMLKDQFSEDPRFVERFRREARAAAALSHPNIANVFDYGEDADRHFIVMELARGRDLAWVMREEGKLPPERAGRIATNIAEALGHAHAAGLVHRDVKPANVIVGEDDRVKVTDFGIARAVGESTLTATGSVLGTAQYISPEQASGTPVGPQSDIYSLGIVLYEMLTGSLPFTGDSPLAVAMRHVNDDIPPPSRLNPNVPPHLDEIVAGSTAKDPARRFSDGAALAEALHGSMPTTTAPMPAAGGATQVMRPSEQWPFPGHPSPWDARRLGKIVLIVFGVLLLVAAAALAYRLTSADRPSDGGREPRREQPAPEDPTVEEEVADIVVADVVGSSVEEAEAEIAAQGLNVETVFEPNGEFEEGLVFAQDPGAGTTVSEGETVTLLVSAGEEDPDEGDDGDDDEGPGGGPPDEPPGKEKKDDDD